MRGGAAGKLDLGDLRGLTESRGGRRVFAHVDAALRLEPLRQVIDKQPVHVAAAQPGIAAGGLDLEDSLAELHDRDVQRPAAEVDHRDPQLLAAPVEAVGQRSGRRLVDQADGLDPGDGAGVLGRAALVVVEVGGHGHDRLLDGLPQEGLGIALDLLQQEGGELLRREVLAAQMDRFAPAHPPLEAGRGAVRIGRGLAPRRLADQHRTVGGQRDIAGKGLASQAHAFGAGNDHGPPATQDRRGRVGGSKIDSDDRHGSPPMTQDQSFDPAD